MSTVSLIIPVYNVEPYVERCVRSVMAQTYTDLECIIVDDCTPDDSIEKCEKLINEYNGPIDFKILHHEHNRGLSAARNTGTDAASGEYIYYLDSDDEITPDCLSLLVHETKLHPEVELVQGGVKAIPYNPWFELSYYQHPSYIDNNDWIRYNFFKSGEEIPVMAWNKLVRKVFIDANHFSFKEGLIHEDELWTLQLVKKLKRIAIVGQTTYLYYRTDNSIMSTTSQNRSALSWMYITKYALDEVDKPYRRLQLYKYLWIFLDRYDCIYKSKEGIITALASIISLIHCGHKRLVLDFIRTYVLLYIFKTHRLSKLKENIENLWEVESNRPTNS